MATLDLGCGGNKTPGAVGVDSHALPGVDIVHDLNAFPYPFETDSFDRVVLRHAVEHVDDVVGLMSEVHRVGKPGGIVEIFTPHFTSMNSYLDPTHRHHFSLLTFDFFCGGTAHGHVARSRFKLLRRRVEFWPIHDRLPFRPAHWMGMRRLAERHPVLYERSLVFLFPIKEFTVELQILK